MTRIALAGLFCLSLSANSFAKDQAWPRCRGTDPDARIAGCSQVIARGSKESKRNRTMAFINRGGAYLAKGDFDRAIADYGKALELDHKLVAAYDNRAKAYRAEGDLDKALADFDEATKLEPRSALARVDRGAVYQAKGDLDRAIADYDEAIELDPKYANAFLNRATAYREKRDFEHAKEDLEAALTLNPQLGSAKKALDDVNELIARNAAAAPTAPVSPPTAAPITLPSGRWIVALLGLVLGAFIIWIVWFFWLKRR